MGTSMNLHFQIVEYYLYFMAEKQRWKEYKNIVLK